MFPRSRKGSIHFIWACHEHGKCGEEDTLTGSTKYPEQFASGINNGGLMVFRVIVLCFSPDIPLRFSSVISSEPLALKAEIRGLDRKAARVG